MLLIKFHKLIPSVSVTLNLRGMCQSYKLSRKIKLVQINNKIFMLWTMKKYIHNIRQTVLINNNNCVRHIFFSFIQF